MTDIQTVECAQCGLKIPIAHRVWFFNERVYCLTCGTTLRKNNA